jgi:NAD(P)-dependent dehydrogenase (short-subunit alcohol dehydrogenase family)
VREKIDMHINGSTVVVTGGQRGLGQAITEAFLTAGASKVYVTARTPQPSPDTRIVPVALEVTDADSVASLAALATDATIVVNNAGVNQHDPILDVDIDNVRTAFETNVYGALRVAQAFRPVLVRNHGGLVNILSVMSWAGGAAAYGATKAAAWSLTNSLRIAYAREGVAVAGVHLSYTDTDMTQWLDVHKSNADDVAAHIVNALAAGDSEILVDDDTRRAKKLLSGPPEGLAYTIINSRVVFEAEAALQ